MRTLIYHPDRQITFDIFCLAVHGEIFNCQESVDIDNIQELEIQYFHLETIWKVGSDFEEKRASHHLPNRFSDRGHERIVDERIIPEEGWNGISMDERNNAKEDGDSGCAC